MLKTIKGMLGLELFNSDGGLTNAGYRGIGNHADRLADFQDRYGAIMTDEEAVRYNNAAMEQCDVMLGILTRYGGE